MKYIVLLCCILTEFHYGSAKQNPFRRPASVKTDTVDETRNSPPEMPVKNVRSRNRIWKLIPFGRELLSAQRALSGKLTGTLRAIKAHPHPSTIAVLLIFAFLYGIIHSLGPGHAKTLFISHGVTRRSPHRATWIAGAVFSLTHTGTAMLLFTIFKLLLGLKTQEQDMFSRNMITISGILIIIAGIIIIVSSMLEKRAHSAAGGLLRRSTGLVPVAVIAGLAPCPGAFLIMTFSAVIGVLPVGVAAVIAVSLGMAVTVSFAGMAGSSIGKTIDRDNTHKIWRLTGTIIRCGAAGIIIVIGMLMAIG
jgi:nickel/cobalt transporter (NicO) family protein